MNRVSQTCLGVAHVKPPWKVLKYRMTRGQLLDRSSAAAPHPLIVFDSIFVSAVWAQTD